MELPILYHILLLIINKLINNIGMSDIWITQLRNPKTDQSKKSFMTKILTRLKDISTQTILATFKTQINQKSTGNQPEISK